MKWKTTLLFLFFVLATLLIPSVLASTTVHYESDRGCVFASSGKGVGFVADRNFTSVYRESNVSYAYFWFFDGYGLYTTGANMTVTKWFENTWLNYTVTGAGTQKLYPSPLQGAKPSSVYLDGVSKSENDGWTFSGGIVTVTAATVNASLSWSEGVDNPPEYGTVTVSTTKASETATLSCAWTDDYLLASGLLSHNKTGVWQNQTEQVLSGSSDTFSDTLLLPSTVGTVVAYKFYAKDNSEQWAATPTLYLTTTMADTGSSSFTPSGGGFSLVVTVQSSQGVVSNAKVSVVNSFAVTVASKLSDKNGKAKFNGLAEGWYDIVVDSERGVGLEKMYLAKDMAVTVVVGSPKPLFPFSIPSPKEFVTSLGVAGQSVAAFLWANLGAVAFCLMGFFSVYYGRSEDDNGVIAIGFVLLGLAVGVYFLASFL